MYYKNYGDINDQKIKVSAIGMGTMRYNDDDVKAGRFEKCAEVALYAHSKGINYFDTAPFYCSDKSEEITGIALSQLKRDSFFVSSKTNVGTVASIDGENAKIVNADTFRRRLEQSLKRIKVDYLDFYHLWCLLDINSYERQHEQLYKFFEQAKSEGLIKNIVFSAHMQGDDLEKAVNDGRYKGMLIGYNALNYRFRQSGILAANKKGMGVVVMNPLGGGLIPQNPKEFEYLTKNTDLTVAQAALRFVASHKEITITLAGIENKSQVDDAVKSVENLQEFTIEEINEKYKNDGLALNNLCTSCGYCNHCPVSIPIPKYMDAYNVKILKGDVVDRLEGHWDIKAIDAKKCIKCGKCETLCTQHLNIMERLKEISDI
ncbi:MAG: aldo/keto reductase [Oscillospiraceae bacterium]